ncbi:HNH endonuclease [Leptospira kmetyi]|uniref:HNH endonuclease n=1 Tax=Leptospira kmetyi TaxID=408139 RepID=UPI0010837687|nr:hypothetical protein [Leptospira kmetyi]TGK23558.1 hypothetical protein EHO62_00010 [Leptospira kmetyi]
MKKKKENIEFEESEVFRFKMEHFKSLLKKQNKKCYVTGRNLTAGNVNGAHIVPIMKGGEHEFENLCLVIEELKQLKRYKSMDDIVSYAVDIINIWGKKYGYSIAKNRKRIS